MKLKCLFVSLAFSATLIGCGSANDTQNSQTADKQAQQTADSSTNDVQLELIPRELIFGNPTYSSVQISPNGSMISYLAPVDGVMNIWVAPADDFASAKPITTDKGRGIRGYGWVAGMEKLLYVQDKGGDENFLLYGVDPKTGEETLYTPFENTRVLFLASSSDIPGKQMIGINNRDPRWHDVYELDVNTGELTLVFENTENFGGFSFDNDLTMRFGQKSTSAGGSEYYKKNDDAWELFLEIPPEDLYTTGLAGFSKDNKTLYLQESKGRDTSALLAMDLETGEKTLVAEDDRADIGGTWRDKDTGVPYVYSVNYDKNSYVALDDRGKEILAKLEAQFDGEFARVSATQDEETWIVLNSQSNKVASYYSWDLKTNTFSRLFATRPELEDKTLALMTPEMIKSRDGLTLVSYLTLPPGADADGDGRPEQALPLVLNVHGGPWARDSYGYRSTPQWLANRGYAVLQVNFRGSTGFGKSFVNAGDLEWGLKMHDDLIDAIDWAVAEKITTNDKIAIMGGSYGGYATLAGLTITPDRFACGVDIVGPSNLETLLASIPPYWESFRKVLEKRVGDPNTEEGLAILKKASPLNSVDNIVKPLLIGQGANDPRVKQAESDQIVDAMKAKNIPVTYALFPDEGHGFARPENRLAFYGVAEGFLANCLGGNAEPIGDDLTGSSLTVPAGAEDIEGLSEALKGFTSENRG
ncbi:alpha/beta hydrolase family protein [Thalassotalea sp. PS06]|uniref:S9 family peptidase n=1 Tax=Thalassotalea sp. PS06 TaxID=2594005 RepID=UPI0011634F59|nr:S9 family peptidase [Thalassotalea sp. PS06]QDP02757.1 S9 family peptidase [Thalassotalea sp. PS06]